MMKRNIGSLFEPLESRRMLAGVTVLIHGHQGNITGWVTAAADAIASRVGSSQVSQYIMKIAENSQGNLAVTSFNLQKGPKLENSTVAEAVVKLDWTAVDDGSYSTDSVGKVAADYLVAAHGSMRALAELPIHLIGHSRGASMVVGISQQLGVRGILVDQNTFLDPHPVDGSDIFVLDYGDIPMRVYSNVVFADNYWRTDGARFNADPDGEHINIAHEGNLNNIVQKKYVVSAHMAVTSYYHGTIDTKAVTNRDHPIFSSWYGNTSDRPARGATGFYFSRIGGGRRPADGLGRAFGGSADRRAVGEQGSQWSNLTNLSISGGSKFTAGKKLTVNFRRQDRDSASSITLYLDRDRNPYNSNMARTMRRAELSQSDDVITGRISAATSGAASGKYYVAARITDAQGHSRWAYTQQIQLT